MNWPPIDPDPFSRNGSIAIFATSIMHLIQATLISRFSEAANATDTTSLLFVFQTIGLDKSAMVLLMVATATLATLGMLLRLGWTRLAMFMPQHFFLGVMAIGGIFAVAQGKYLDGTVVIWAHILTDQLPIIALFFVHSGAIIRRSWDLNG